MKRTGIALGTIVCLLTAFTAGVRADVKEEVKNQVKFEGMLGRMFNMFGGKAAKEGLVTKRAIKGDRQMTVTGDRYGQIIDLAEEKIYDLDLDKKTYKVTTFEELRRRMREAEEKAKQDREKQEKSAEQEKGPEYEIDVDSKATGQTKAINGFDTRQVVTTVTVRQKGKTIDEGGGMLLTMDSWLAPKIPAAAEVTAFNMRYWQKLQGPQAGALSAEQLAAAMAIYPMLKEALGRVNTEGAKVDGTPILSTMTVQAVKDPAQAKQESESSSDGGGGLGGMLARKMMRKKADDQATGGNKATIMTTTTEVLSVTPSAVAEDVALPAGFKEKN